MIFNVPPAPLNLGTLCRSLPPLPSSCQASLLQTDFISVAMRGCVRNLQLLPLYLTGVADAFYELTDTDIHRDKVFLSKLSCRAIRYRSCLLTIQTFCLVCDVSVRTYGICCFGGIWRVRVQGQWLTSWARWRGHITSGWVCTDVRLVLLSCVDFDMFRVLTGVYAFLCSCPAVQSWPWSSMTLWPAMVRSWLYVEVRRWNWWKDPTTSPTGVWSAPPTALPHRRAWCPARCSASLTPAAAWRWKAFSTIKVRLMLFSWMKLGLGGHWRPHSELDVDHFLYFLRCFFACRAMFSKSIWLDTYLVVQDH